jgi:hypothetical protein
MTKAEIGGNGTAASVHLVLQGKGGVGKSFVSSILAQYFRTKSAPVYCLDTDPVNATFAQYRQLDAEHLKVLKRGTVNEKQFDVFVQRVCKGQGVFIVDTGATTFVPIWNYILENEILEFFRPHERRVFVHSVVTGGQAMTDTLNGLERLAQTTSQKNIIVWLNEYFGEVSKDGKSFEEFEIAEEHAHKLVGSVLIRDRNPQTFGDDVRQMLEQRLTFDEAIKDERFFLVSKQRLAIVRRDLFEQLDRLEIG